MDHSAWDRAGSCIHFTKFHSVTPNRFFIGGGDADADADVGDGDNDGDGGGGDGGGSGVVVVWW